MFGIKPTTVSGAHTAPSYHHPRTCNSSTFLRGPCAFRHISFRPDGDRPRNQRRTIRFSPRSYMTISNLITPNDQDGWQRTRVVRVENHAAPVIPHSQRLMLNSPRWRFHGAKVPRKNKTSGRPSERRLDFTPLLYSQSVR